MGELLASWYPLLKALHLLAVIAWVGGMVTVPLLYAAHSALPEGDAAAQPLVGLERRLLGRLVTPAMVAVWLIGILLLIANPGVLRGSGWMHAKLTLVLALSGLHGFLAASRRRLEQGQRRSPATWRWSLAGGAALAAAVVLLAVLRPF